MDKHSVKPTMAFIILGAAIYFLRDSPGNALEYIMAIIAVLIFWYLLGLKIALSNLRTTLIIAIVFAVILTGFRLFSPLRSSEGTMGALKDLDLNPAQIGLIKGTQHRALELHYDREPSFEDRYTQLGFLIYSDDGLHYSNRPQKLNLLKLPKTLIWSKNNLKGNSLDEDTAAIKALFVPSFAYSLSPGTLDSPTPLDQFLFERRAGFCEHYAASLCTLLDLKGYKSRVVYGYAGGTWNPIFKVLTYDSTDAHAWVEVFDPALRQFKTIDPTSWIFPEVSRARSFKVHYSWVYLTLMVIACLARIFFIQKGNGIELFLFKVSKLESKYNLKTRGLTLSERISKLVSINPSLEERISDSFKTYIAMYKVQGLTRELDKALKKSLRAW